MKIKVRTVVEAEIEPDELAAAVMEYAQRCVALEDDAGLDWRTDGKGNTYVGGADWLVSRNPEIAAMIEGAYALRGKAPEHCRISETQINEWIGAQRTELTKAVTELLVSETRWPAPLAQMRAAVHVAHMPEYQLRGASAYLVAMEVQRLFPSQPSDGGAAL